MCDGSDYGSISSATISKGSKESFSDDGSRDYGEGGATGGGTTPDGKEQIAYNEEWYVSKEYITSMIVLQLDYAIKSRGVMTKRRKGEKQNQLYTCVDNKMAIYQGPVVNMSQLSGFSPTLKCKVLEPQEELVEEHVN